MIITAPVTDYIPASILTTLNDLVVRGAADPARYGQLSAVAATRTLATTIPQAVWTLFNFDEEYYDVNGEFNTATHEFVPNRDKYIFVSAGVKIVGLVIASQIGIRIYRDAVLRAEKVNIIGGGGNCGINACCGMLITTAQALSVEIYHTTAGGRDTDGTIGTNWLSIFEIPVVP